MNDAMDLVDQEIDTYEREEKLQKEMTPILLSELSEEYENINWVWEGFLATGHITLISALWKSGKTTLLTALFRAIEKQQLLASQQTHTSKILIVSEESKAMWYRRREDNELKLPIWLISRPLNRKMSNREWEMFLGEIVKDCKEHEIKTVIIDTLSAFWPVQNENDASIVESALLPLNQLLKQNIAVLLVHHFRKSGGEEGTAARGSGALGSHVDIMVDFKRMGEDDPSGTKRVLTGYSRFEETPREVVIDLVEGEYKTLGSRRELAMNNKIGTVLGILKEFPEGLTADGVYDNWHDDLNVKRPKSKRTVQRYLKDLLNRANIKLSGEKSVGKTTAPIYRLTHDSTSSYSSVLSRDTEAKTSDKTDGTLPGMSRVTGGLAEEAAEEFSKQLG